MHFRYLNKQHSFGNRIPDRPERVKQSQDYIGHDREFGDPVCEMVVPTPGGRFRVTVFFVYRMVERIMGRYCSEEKLYAGTYYKLTVVFLLRITVVGIIVDDVVIVIIIIRTPYLVLPSLVYKLFLRNS